MFRFIKRCLLPTRLDACCVVVAIHWIMAIWCVFVPPMSSGVPTVDANPVMFTAGATWLAIAVVVVWKSNSTRRTLLLILSSVSSVLFVVVWSYLNVDAINARNSFASPGMPEFDPDLFLFEFGTNLKWYVLAAVAAWLINLLLKYLIGMSNGLWQFKGDRSKALVGVAVAMFTLAIASRTYLSFAGSAGVEHISMFAVFGVLSVAGWMVVMFWFPRSMAESGKPIQKVFSVILVLMVMLPFALNGMEIQEVVISTLNCIVFILSVIGVGGWEVSGSSEVEETVSQVGSRPSLLSAAAVLLMVSAVMLPWFVDIAALTYSIQTAKKTTFAEQFALVREVADVRRESDGRIAPVYQPSSRSLLWQAQFDDQAPKDLLNVLQGKSILALDLHGLTPEFDVSVLNGNGARLSLTDCEVSKTQLSQILNSSTWLSVNEKFSVVEDGTEVDSGTVTGVSFNKTERGTVGKFFEAAKIENQMLYLQVHSPVGNEDWAAIEEVAQTGSVYLGGGWTSDFEMPQKTRSLSRVLFRELTESGQRRAVDKDLLLNTDMRFYGNAVANSPKLNWNLIMLRGNGGGYEATLGFEESGKTLDEFAKEIGMAWRLNDDGSIHSLYLPWTSSLTEVAALADLRVLSFDPNWVGGAVNGSSSDPVDVSYLKSQANLEELYFESNFVPVDLSFLEHQVSLKHLQIPSVVRKVTGPIGFDACQSLESITFLGTPDNKTYFEVSGLKNLKRLVIVNVEEDAALTPEYEEKLREKLPDVEVKIIQPTEMDSLIPDSFREHRDRVRKELRADTSWLDELSDKQP